MTNLEEEESKHEISMIQPQDVPTPDPILAAYIELITK